MNAMVARPTVAAAGKAQPCRPWDPRVGNGVCGGAVTGAAKGRGPTAGVRSLTPGHVAPHALLAVSGPRPPRLVDREPHVAGPVLPKEAVEPRVCISVVDQHPHFRRLHLAVEGQQRRLRRVVGEAVAVVAREEVRVSRNVQRRLHLGVVDPDRQRVVAAARVVVQPAAVSILRGVGPVDPRGRRGRGLLGLVLGIVLRQRREPRRAIEAAVLPGVVAGAVVARPRPAVKVVLVKALVIKIVPVVPVAPNWSQHRDPQAPTSTKSAWALRRA